MRKRTAAEYRPITISLERALIAEIELKLKPKQSRSAWIADAITAKLNAKEDLEQVSASDILAELQYRGILTHSTRWTLQKVADSKASTDEH